MDLSQKQLIEIDENFSFPDFLEGAKKAFEMIVVSYNNNKLEDVNNLLSKEVYEDFDKSIDKTKERQGAFSVKEIKASILDIKVIKKLAKIKIEFLSNQENILNNNIKKNNNIKDIWTFERDMEELSPIWTLVEVGIE